MNSKSIESSCLYGSVRFIFSDFFCIRCSLKRFYKNTQGWGKVKAYFRVQGGRGAKKCTSLGVRTLWMTPMGKYGGAKN